MSVEWLEDTFSPRVDELAKPLRWWSRRLPAEHPENFRPGDVVRIMPTGEAVFVLDVDCRVVRAIGSLKRKGAAKGSPVYIIGNTSQLQLQGRRHLTYRRWWWRPSRKVLVSS